MPGQRIRAEDYGKPMRCPHCPTEYDRDRHLEWILGIERVWVRGYYGWLKLPGLRTPVCPNCGTALVGARRRRSKGSPHDDGFSGGIAR